MSAVIKPSDLDRASRIRALSLEPPAPQPSAEALALAATETRLAAALKRISELEAETERLKAETASAFARGREAGLESGRQAAEDRSAALLAKVETAAGQAVSAFGARLAALETSAGDLAALALSRITGEPGTRTDLVAAAVRRVLAETALGAAVRVEVSAIDFPDPSTLAAVAAASGADVAALDRPSGACRIVLRLGEIDLGLDGQVARLRALLETGA